MKTNLIRNLLSSTVVVLLLLAGGRAIAEAGVSAKKVLVFANKRNFNDPVISKVVDTLKKEGCAVKLESGKKLHGVSASKYGAIVIFNFIDRGQKDRGVKVYADENVQKKIALFNAVGSDYLEPDRGSGETKEIKIEKLAAEIVDKVQEVLSKQ